MRAKFFATCALSAAFLFSCSDDDESAAIDAMPTAIDAMPNFSDGAGVVCQNAQASYPGSIFSPAATNDGNSLEFFGELGSQGAPDKLRMLVATDSAATGTFSLPHQDWSTSICLGDSDNSCSDELVAYSGTLRVDSVFDRFQASVTEVIFVDSVATPTCSAALAQATVDVAILTGP